MTPLSFFDRRGARRQPGHGPNGWTLGLVALMVIIATAATEGAAPDDLHDFLMTALAFIAVGIAIAGLIAVWTIVLVACWRAIDEETSDGER